MKTWFLTALICAFAVMAHAATSQRDMVAEAKLENDLAKLDPALVAPFREARIAMDKRDYAASVRLLRAVVEKAPTFDAAVRRLASSLAAAGNRTEGLQWAEKAVALKRSAYNLTSLAYILVVVPKGQPATADLTRAQALLHEAAALPEGQDVYTVMLTAQVALQLNRIDDARLAVAKLEQIAPNEMTTHYFAAFVAAADEHWVKAEREIRRAQELGLEAQAAQGFLDSGIHRWAVAWRLIGGTAWVIGLWAAGLTLLCLLGFVLSRATLRQIARSEPSVPITPGEHRLRRIYRVVLNVAGVYYYLSLPIVVVLVVAAAGGIVYGFLVAGWIPIKLLLLLVIGAIATIWSMGRSLFLKVKAEDPGRALGRDEAEGLWKLTGEVAAALNTRPVDEIRITPGTDLCVYERGTWREKMENKAARVLVIGAAVLNDFKQQDFRSVLAHEYGHFAHRDTAGGDVALRVRNDIMKFYLAMLQARQATWLNIAFHFLRLYHFIFRRISHGATRLQEVLADRIAAQTYGPLAFEGGLRHAIRRSIEFDAHANREIKAAIDAKRPIQNLYQSVGEKSDTVEREFEQAMQRPTTDDDTHPAPQDRFRLIARIPAPPHEPPPGYVWDLFKDPVAVQGEMMATVEKHVAAHRG